MPKRLGKADGGGTSAKACSDSSQGQGDGATGSAEYGAAGNGKGQFFAQSRHASLPFGCYLSRRCWYLSITELIDTAAVKWKSCGGPKLLSKARRKRQTFDGASPRLD